MERSFLYIADGKLFRQTGSNLREIRSEMLESYVRRVRESAERTAWKRSGEGAMFTQTYDPGADAASRVSAIYSHILCAGTHKGSLIYTLAIDDTCGIYIKNTEESENEGIVMSSGTTAYREFDIKDDRMTIAAAFAGESHIGVLRSGTTQFNTYTEGRSYDSEPVWSRAHSDSIYFCSAGLAIADEESHAPGGRELSYQDRMAGMYANAVPTERGPSAICLLNIADGTMQEVLSHTDFDFVHPQSTADGALYYIRKPFREGKESDGLGCLADIFMVPFRLFRAIFSFFNLFSVKYSGKTLSRAGDIKQRDETQIRIDGNFINAERELQENRKRGEKNPGIIPRSWELHRLASDGTDTLLKRGVVAYRVDEKTGDILFSNGSGVFLLTAEGKEEKLSSADRVTFIGY